MPVSAGLVPVVSPSIPDVIVGNRANTMTKRMNTPMNSPTGPLRYDSTEPLDWIDWICIAVIAESLFPFADICRYCCPDICERLKK